MTKKAAGRPIKYAALAANPDAWKIVTSDGEVTTVGEERARDVLDALLVEHARRGG